jgi:hypothetical protein
VIPKSFFYSGSIYQKAENTPLPILKLIAKLVDNGYIDATWEIHYAGSNGTAFSSLLEKEKLPLKYTDHGYLEHKSLYQLISCMEYVLLCMPYGSDTTSWIPARFYDYIANNSRLICLVSPGSEVSKMLEHYKNAVVVYHDEPESVQISKVMQFFSNKRESNEKVFDFISSFSRRELASRLANIFNNIVDWYKGR